jgi:hypothetical protein
MTAFVRGSLRFPTGTRNRCPDVQSGLGILPDLGSLDTSKGRFSHVRGLSDLVIGGLLDDGEGSVIIRLQPSYRLDHGSRDRSAIRHDVTVD